MKLILALLIVVFLVSVFADPEAADRSRKDDGRDDKSCHKDDKSCKDRRCRKECCQGPEGPRGVEGPYGRDGRDGLPGRDGEDCIPAPLAFGQFFGTEAFTIPDVNGNNFIPFPSDGVTRGVDRQGSAPRRFVVERAGDYFLTASLVVANSNSTGPSTCTIWVNNAALAGDQYSFLAGPGGVNTITVPITVAQDNSIVRIGCVFATNGTLNVPQVPISPAGAPQTPNANMVIVGLQ